MRLRTLLRSRRSLFLLLLLAAAACAVVLQVEPIGKDGKPFVPAEDERELWTEARRFALRLEHSPKLYHDPALEAYLTRLGNSLLPPEVRSQPVKFTFKVVMDPSLNAFVYPHGAGYVHTGLLARLENEAQLAAVLGHELAHAVERHALLHHRQKTLAKAASQVLGAAIIAGGAVVAGERAAKGEVGLATAIGAGSLLFGSLGVYYGYQAAVSGYGRALENDADERGAAWMAAAGYDPRQASRVFEILLQDYGDGSALENFFYGQHPLLRERVSHLRELVGARFAGQLRGKKVDSLEFRLRTAAVARNNAVLDMAAGRWNVARAALEKALTKDPGDSAAQYYLGMLDRKLEGGPRARRQALRGFLLAARNDPAFAAPHREMGYLFYADGQYALARRAFRRYLSLEPRAPDRDLVRRYLSLLEGR